MASSKNYLQFVLEQLSELDEITYRTMMGEFIIYYRGKIVGGIYDDRLLVKPTKSAIAYMTDPVYEVPYEGAKEMLQDCSTRCMMNCRCPNPKRKNRYCEGKTNKWTRQFCIYMVKVEIRKRQSIIKCSLKNMM